MLCTSLPVKIALLGKTNGWRRVTCRQRIALWSARGTSDGAVLINMRAFRLPRDVNEICTLLGLYAAYSGSSGQTVRGFGTTYRSYFQVSSSQLPWHLKMGPVGFAETSVHNCHSTLLKIAKERRYNSRLCLGMVKATCTVCSLHTPPQILV